MQVWPDCNHTPPPMSRFHVQISPYPSYFFFFKKKKEEEEEEEEKSMHALPSNM